MHAQKFIAKWIWQWSKSDEKLWKTIIKVLYGNQGNALRESHYFKSQLKSIIQFCECFITRSVWDSSRITKCSLSTTYSHLFDLCSNPYICVQDVIESRGAMLRFRRNLHGILLSEWHEIVAIIISCSLTDNPDFPT